MKPASQPASQPHGTGKISPSPNAKINNAII